MVGTEEDIQQLLQESYDCRLNNMERSFSLAKKALKISIDANYQFLEADSYNKLSLYHMIIGNYDRSIELANKALEYFEPNNIKKGIADAHYNIASVKYKSTNYHDGLKHLLSCLKLYRELDDYSNQAKVLKSMGTIYEFFGDEDNAVDSYERSIEASKKVSAENLESNALNPLSGIYLNRGETSLAMKTIERSVTLKKKTNDIRGLGFALYGRAKVYSKERKFELAETDYLKSLEIHREMGDHLGEGMIYHKLGHLYLEMRKYDEAENILKKALEVAYELDIALIKYKAYYLLYDLSKRQNNTDNSLHYLERYIQTKEQVLNSETYRVIKSYQSIAKIESLERDAKIQKEKADIIESKNVELDSFFYRISHDLKGPISSLMGLNNLMKKDVKSDMGAYLEMNEMQLNRINTIVMELIKLTHMNHADQKFDIIDFERLVYDCMNSYKYLPNFDKIDFDIAIDSAIKFKSEWSIVNTIVQNLIENSIKYSKGAHAKVKVEISQITDQISILVKDNGVGIANEHHDKIFDMFYRANSSSEGTGLGLFILKRAVERLHGSVDFTSVEGSGTRFQVLLPL